MPLDEINGAARRPLRKIARLADIQVGDTVKFRYGSPGESSYRER